MNNSYISVVSAFLLMFFRITCCISATRRYNYYKTSTTDSCMFIFTLGYSVIYLTINDDDDTSDGED